MQQTSFPTHWKRTAAALFCALLLNLALAAPAFAHAELLLASPTANAHLDQAPVQVELIFSENLEPTFSTLHVIGSDGQNVNQQPSTVDPAHPDHLVVRLGKLPEGVYTVSWKAVSLVDGHQTSGAYPFTVGQVETAVTNARQESQVPTVAVWIKWLLLGSIAPLVGFVLFSRYIWQPTLTGLTGISAELPQASTIMRLSLLALFAALGLSLLNMSAQGQGMSWPWAPETTIFLTQTRLGAIWLARLLLGLVMVWAFFKQSVSWKLWMGFGSALALLGTISLSSHAAAGSAPLLPVLIDWLHLAAMCAWLGGLIYLLIGIKSFRKLAPDQFAQLTGQVVQRFSILALISVACLFLTGLYAAAQRLGKVQALWTTPYGDALAVKLGLFVTIMFPAAYNLLILSPSVNQPRQPGPPVYTMASRFQSTIRLELVLLAALLLPVSLMTYLSPARIGPAFDGSLHVSDLQLELAVTPGWVGENNFSLHLATDTPPLTAPKDVILRFTPTAANLPPSEIQLVPLDGGDFHAQGSNLSQVGSWQVQAIVRRPDKYDVYASFDLTVEKPAAAAPAANPLVQNSGWLLLAASLACWMAFRQLALRERTQSPSRLVTSLGWICSAALFVCGLLML